MEFLNVVAAALAAFAFGAVWYITMSKPWLAASGIPLGPDGKPAAKGSPAAFVVGLVAMVIVAGMMRHVMASSGVVTPGGGAVAGLGIGAFLITPWVAMNYAFGMRKPALTVIDGVNSVVGCAIMGLVLNLF